MLSSEKDLLQELVGIASLNPVLASQTEESVGEAILTDFLVSFCQKQGWPWLRQRVHPGRDNVVAMVENGSSPDDCPAMLWEAHQDTVGISGMTIDPFAAETRLGRLWGRGACDTKGGMAAMLAAAIRLQQEQPDSHPTLVLAFTVNEECGFTGAKALGEIWAPGEPSLAADLFTGPLSPEQLRSRRPQQAIVAEPTSLHVVVAHQGVLRWKCRTRGQAAHTSRPEEGVNAIYAMAQVVQAIERFHGEQLHQSEPHPLCGTPSVSVSTIRGGTGVNTVPDEAEIDIDRRLAPGEPPETAFRQLVDWIADTVGDTRAEIAHDHPWLTSDGLDNRANMSWAERVAAEARSIAGTGKLIGAPYATDAPAIARCGIPTVVFGPGSIDQAHTVDEWIDLVRSFPRPSKCFVGWRVPNEQGTTPDRRVPWLI